MAIKYGFFNSVNGDRLYNADDIGDYYTKLISDGVFANPSTNLQVQEASAMTVVVAPGWGFIKCKWINNKSNYTLHLDAADVALNRIDRIVMRLDLVERTMSLEILKGETAAHPTAPDLTRVDGETWELSLAKIYIAAGTTEISQSMITDERPDNTVCGFITGLIDQIDTSELFAQYNAAFYDWFNNLQETLVTKTRINRITNTVVTSTNNVENVAIGIPDFAEDTDILNVFVNGYRLVPDVEYTYTSNIISFTNTLDVIGTIIEIEVLKNVYAGTDISVAGISRLVSNAVGIPGMPVSGAASLIEEE